MNYKYGMSADGNLVTLPSTETIVWKFMSYPSSDLFNGIKEQLVVSK